MVRCPLVFEEIDDELYVVRDGETIARIIDFGDNNYLIRFEDGTEIPEHGLDNAKNYFKNNRF